MAAHAVMTFMCREAPNSCFCSEISAVDSLYRTDMPFHACSLADRLHDMHYQKCDTMTGGRPQLQLTILTSRAATRSAS